MPKDDGDVLVPERVCGLIGHPVRHSMGPALHNWALQRADLPWVYMAWDVDPDDLGRMMDAVRLLPIAGLSVTIPHKVAVMEYLDGVSERARKVGAVNTLHWHGTKLLGENTDVDGFLAPLEAMGKAFDSAMVLGAGGAARAALTALQHLGIPDIRITNRTRSKAEALAADFGVDVVDWEARTKSPAALLVNTTSLGMSGDHVEDTPWPAEAFPAECTAYDIVYNPLRTRFLREARDAGCAVVDGLNMFVHQGLAQFRLWTGQSFPTDLARTLLLEQLRG
ncbi:shikimate dehydrogenase [Oceanidesulfovibrio marinus]|uniref:Shikimate dehydrogenase (NADP(+)) n=1 Tax=Oceanidesulfovibrio marinus TaxID=370038 RepID=A0A6P1ZNG4_9BACT|nr:shikimate dehydrogenase [Oceanidesulfovibrio marinus]TVM35867.1 shikimate dehydrogenase [Oceanidesulfovibrio marinus]